MGTPCPPSPAAACTLTLPLPALRTKLGPRLQHGRTRLALHLLRHPESALGTELGAMRLGAALRTNELHLLAHFVPQAAPLPFIVRALRCAGHLALRTRTRDRHLHVRRAIEAQPVGAVET